GQGGEGGGGGGPPAGLVAEAVGPAAVGVDAVEVTQQPPRQEQRGDREVFVMSAGQACAVDARFGRRDQRGRAVRAVTGQVCGETVLHGGGYKRASRIGEPRGVILRERGDRGSSPPPPNPAAGGPPARQQCRQPQGGGLPGVPTLPWRTRRP